ncbi:MAG: RraA family protein [Sciscionella sp.]
MTIDGHRPVAAAPAGVVASDLALATEVSASALYETAGGGALPRAIKPVHRGFRVCGSALPVTCPPGDNLWLHRAIALAGPGEVIIAYLGGAYDFGYWGEVMSCAAAARNIGGVVLDGCARDGAGLGARGLPVFSRGLCVVGTAKHPDGVGAVGHPVTIGGVQIYPGDLVVGDRDGVVVVPAGAAHDAVARAIDRTEEEVVLIDRLRSGVETTIDLYCLPREEP